MGVASLRLKIAPASQDNRHASPFLVHLFSFNPRLDRHVRGRKMGSHPAHLRSKPNTVWTKKGDLCTKKTGFGTKKGPSRQENPGRFRPR